MAERGGGSCRHSTRGKKGQGDPMAAGLSHLARRSRTISELRSFLLRKGFPGAAIDQVVSRLKEMGCLNDREYAERFVASAWSRPRGRARLRSELLAKGVASDVIESTLASSFASDEESAALNRALLKAVSRPEEGLDAAGRRRVASRLLRKGFAPGNVMQAIAAMGRNPIGDDGPSMVDEEES